ncbi:MAG: phosphopantothenoylcysteine decarboxylase [Pirellulaceae bacterium]
MARILITSGPTRQYLDPVRYLSNGSSGRMGACLAQAAIDLGHQVIVVSGPVQVDYPAGALVVPVVTTQEMLAASQKHFADCDGMIGAAAPCDYMPRQVQSEKIHKTGQPLIMELVETPDIVATLACQRKPSQWVVGFALETEDVRFRAISKMQRKCCDLMVSNEASAMDALDNQVEILDRSGQVLQSVSGSKQMVATAILDWIERRLIG